MKISKRPKRFIARQRINAKVELVDVGLIEAGKEVLVGTALKELHLDGLVGDARDDHGTTLEEVGVLQHGIKEDVAHIDVLAGQVPEDPEVAGTVGQGQLNLHAVVVGIGEKAVLRKSVQTERNVKLA